MNELQIEPRHLKIVKDILSKYPIDVRAFGSRVKGTARPLSDLDLVIMKPIEKVDLELLREAFEMSDLPFKIDVISWNEIDERFRTHIKPDLTKITLK